MRISSPFVRFVLPVVLSAAASVAFVRSAFLTPFFLVPIALLGFLSDGEEHPSRILLAAIVSVAIHSAISVPLFGWAGQSPFILMADIAYFAAATLAFAWAVAPSGPFGGQRAIRRAYRYVLAAVVAALSTLPLILLASRDATVVALFRSQAEALTRLYAEAAGPDVVARSLLERSIDVDSILEAAKFGYTRGIAIGGHALLFVFSARMALVFASFRNRSLRAQSSFITFRNDFRLVWVLSSALALVLLGKVSGAELLEIVAWNALVLCGILYLAQGFGVVQYNLMRPGVPRFIAPLATFALILSVFSGINAFVAAAIMVVGVAENWLPLRAPIAIEPPSTPGA